MFWFCFVQYTHKKCDAIPNSDQNENFNRKECVLHLFFLYLKLKFIWFEIWIVLISFCDFNYSCTGFFLWFSVQISILCCFFFNSFLMFKLFFLFMFLQILLFFLFWSVSCSIFEFNSHFNGKFFIFSYLHFSLPLSWWFWHLIFASFMFCFVARNIAFPVLFNSFSNIIKFFFLLFFFSLP